MPKKITILSVGTRGDVQPYLALALGLQRAGHAVSLATVPQFKEFVESYGIEHRPVNGEALELGKTDAGAKAISGKGSVGLMRKVMPMLRRMLDDAWLTVPDAELLIYHPKLLGGPHLAEKLGVPGILAMPVPAFTPTGEFPTPLLTTRSLGGWVNRHTYSLLNWAIMAPYRSLINGWRREKLGLPPGSGRPPAAYLYPVSPQVIKRPTDWDERSLLTGFWFLERPSDWVPSQALVDFLQAGPPPVYVGFGSMPSVDAERVTRMVIAAVRQAGLRAVLAAGSGGMVEMDAGKDISFTPPLPHDWLFPQVAAVVHHGGAGTTATGLRAGKPTLICPFFGDQPFWGARVAALGVGPKPIPQGKLTRDGLAAAMQHMVSDSAMQARAAALGEQIRQEDGVQCVVDYIQRMI